MKNIVLLALVCTAVSAVHAQETAVPAPSDTIRTYVLPEIVVTATRTERNPNDIGRSISVVSAEFLKTSISHSLAEALSFSEGVYLVGAGQNLGANQSIFMRGSGSNHAALMVDDVRITDPSGVNNAIDLSEITLAGVERVEIVRGAHSTLYGSSAIGGVVNLITPKGQLPGVHADAEMRMGTYGDGTTLFNQQLFINFTAVSGFYFNGEIWNSRVHGMDASEDTVTNPAVFNKRDRDGLSALDLMGKAGYKDERLDAYVAFKSHDEEKDIDQSAYTDDENYTLDFRRNLVTYGASYRMGEGWYLKFLGGYSDMRREAVDDSSLVDNAGATDQTYYEQEWRGTMSTNELQASVRLPGFDAVLGAGRYHETMSSKSYYFSNAFGPFELASDLGPLGLQATINSLFAHVDLGGYLLDPSLERFSLALGVRLNDHSAFGSAVTYELNPSVRVTEAGIAYVSYSTGFNAPSLYQLFTPEAYYTSNISRGNARLQPEESTSFEIGLKHALGNSARLTLSYYHTAVEHSIEYVYLWDKNIPIAGLGTDFLRDDYRGDTYLNLGRHVSDGFELSIFARLTDKLTVAGNVSLVSGILRYTPADIDVAHTEGSHVQLYNNGAFLTQELESTEIVRRPNTFNLALVYTPLDEWSVRLDVKHVGSRLDVYYDSQRGPYGALGSTPVKEYTLVELTQRYAVTERFSVGVRVENVFDTLYREVNGFRTRGRGVYISLRYLVGAV